MSRLSYVAITIALVLVADGAQAQTAAQSQPRLAVYVSSGSELIHFDLDAAAARLTRRESVMLPQAVQYAWQHPSRKYLYVAWSEGAGRTQHGVTAFAIDPATGALGQHGEPIKLLQRTINLSTDIPGKNLLIVDNPAGLRVYRLEADGTIGAPVTQAAPLDVGVFAHQIRVDPSNTFAVLVTRGNIPDAGKPEDPGSMRVFSYDDGKLTNKTIVAPNGGFGFQARHLDFHQTKPWVFLSLENQNQLQVFQIAGGTLGAEPLFVKDSVANPKGAGQTASGIHVHPNGRFVYLGNRAIQTEEVEGKRVFAGGENTIAVYSINQNTGEPTLIQSADTHGMSPRTFALDPSGRVLVAANQNSFLRRDGNQITPVASNIALFRVGADGKLTYVTQEAISPEPRANLFWMGVVPLPAEAAAPRTANAGKCESLAALKLPNAAVTLAQTTTAGPFVAPAGGEGNAALKDLPGFCRLALTLRPSSDSDIKMELWLPTTNWNGKFQAVGNGGWAGSISYGALGEALKRGYATASTDTGHVGDTASALLGHPEKLTDFAYRAVHEVTVQSKAIITSFYGQGAQYWYWNGCSGGGRQSLKEAQFYPGDYNGIIAGAPNLDAIRGSAGRMWVALATHQDEASFIPPAKYPLVHDAVLNACDAIDGVKDGVLENPRACKFDPAVLVCKGADSASCLTPPQVIAATKILSPVRDPKSGKDIFPAVEPGAELGWAQQAGGSEVYRTSMEAFKYVVFNNPNWDWKTFDVNTDLARLDKFESPIQATDTNLAPFASRGGKLLMYHGWADQSISPGQTVNYYSKVVDRLGGATKTSSWVRLFMVPGMFHCGGGDGTSSFDMVSALEQWVEKGKAPDSIPASRVRNGVVDRTRPLCPYPQVAAYKGSGSTDEAANFTCKLP